MSGIQPLVETTEMSGNLLIRIIQLLNGLLRGRANHSSTVTLTANTTTTQLKIPGYETQMRVTFSPTTSNAAAALATTYISAKTAANIGSSGIITFTHSNNAQTDRTFDVIWSG